jgi:hypothetical protein
MIPLLLLLEQAAPAATTIAPWAPVAKTDAATGASSVSAFAVSGDGNARLVVRCDHAAEPVVSVQLRTRRPLGATADRPVSMSFDGGAAIESNWEFPGPAAFVRDSAIVTQLTVGLAKAHEIKVKTTDATGSAVEISFGGPTSAAPIAQVLEACGYGLGVVPPPVQPAKAGQ